MLQLIGASNAAASIPFQVFHMPEGHIEPLNSWLERTLSSNPVEAMFGLYDMVCNYSREVVRHLSIYWNSGHLLWYARVSVAHAVI